MNFESVGAVVQPNTWSPLLQMTGLFTDTVHYVVMINGFLLLIYTADANLHVT